MNTIRAVYISTSGYVDPYTKNNLDLVTWAKNAKEKGWGYVWGTYGSVLTRGLYNAKEEQYPDEVGGYADFIKSHWLGGRTADCVGLIKGYGWLDPDDHEVHYGTNGMPDIGADAMYYNASEKGSISTIPEIPGLAVWKSGHIGIYIGNGQVIHASGTMIGVIQSPLGETGWTHWLKIPYITYLDSNVPTAVNEQRIWDTLYAEIGNPYGTAALMGNLFAESSLRSNNLQDSYEAGLGYTDVTYTQAVDDGRYANFTSDQAGYCPSEMPQVQAGGTAEPRLFQENIQKPRANQPVSYREHSQIIRSEWRHKSESDIPLHRPQELLCLCRVCRTGIRSADYQPCGGR